ncbi:MAG: hypothetical protein NC191_05890 [Muribaculaceae bacterium]|nr:hypothetical protein [Muribaculaceae bacterium]
MLMDNVNGVSYSPIYAALDVKNAGSTKYSANQVDLNSLYSKEEIENLISRFDCLHSESPIDGQKCSFDTIFLPENDTLIINNLNMTNDTVEVYKNGSAISVGSWHRKELDGDYSDIINDVKSRIDKSQAAGEAKLAGQMDSMAELGKSQVIKK